MDTIIANIIKAKNLIGASIIKVMKEFGIVGVVTYVGGIILLVEFIREQDLERQKILGIVGVLLLALSIFIAYFRLKIKKDREGALIKMAESTCNRLAEQIGKNLTEKSIETIAQKIRQTQRDLISAIVRDDKKEEDGSMTK